jgi:phosphoadenosine phosphosulfate reductase
MSLSQKVEEAKVLLDSVNKNYAPVVFANSFGAEDMVLTDLIGRNFPNISMFTLDTERLPEETHSLMKEVEDRYNIETKIYFPESVAVKKYIVENGLNGFYDSIKR